MYSTRSLAKSTNLRREIQLSHRLLGNHHRPSLYIVHPKSRSWRIFVASVDSYCCCAHLPAQELWGIAIGYLGIDGEPVERTGDVGLACMHVVHGARIPPSEPTAVDTDRRSCVEGLTQRFMVDFIRGKAALTTKEVASQFDECLRGLDTRYWHDIGQQDDALHASCFDVIWQCPGSFWKAARAELHSHSS